MLFPPSQFRYTRTMTTLSQCNSTFGQTLFNVFPSRWNPPKQGFALILSQYNVFTFLFCLILYARYVCPASGPCHRAAHWHDGLSVKPYCMLAEGFFSHLRQVISLRQRCSSGHRDAAEGSLRRFDTHYTLIPDHAMSSIADLLRLILWKPN